MLETLSLSTFELVPEGCVGVHWGGETCFRWRELQVQRTDTAGTQHSVWREEWSLWLEHSEEWRESWRPWQGPGCEGLCGRAQKCGLSPQDSKEPWEGLKASGQSSLVGALALAAMIQRLCWRRCPFGAGAVTQLPTGQP